MSFLPSYPCRTLYKSGNLRYVPYTPAWKEYHSPLPHATHKGLQYYCWNGRFQVPAWQDNRMDARFVPLTVFLQSHRVLFPPKTSGISCVPPRQLLRQLPTGFYLPHFSGNRKWHYWWCVFPPFPLHEAP